MAKKGQVTVFIILGIVVLAIFGLLYFAISRDYIETPFTRTSVVSVSDHVEECINILGEEAIALIGKQGGDLQPSLYQNWCINSEECLQVSYLCYTEELVPCTNRRPFLSQHMEKEISEYVDEHLIECVDPGLWEESGYSVSLGNYESKVSIGKEDVLITVDWPITIRKDTFVEQEERFSQKFDVPLGLLAETAYDIVQSEISNGDFLVVPYVVSKKGNVEIEKHRPGKSKIYAVNAFQDDYKLYFAVQGWVL